MLHQHFTITKTSKFILHFVLFIFLLSFGSQPAISKNSIPNPIKINKEKYPKKLADIYIKYIPPVVIGCQKDELNPFFVTDYTDPVEIHREMNSHKRIAIGGEELEIQDLAHHLYQYRSLQLYKDPNDSFFVVNGVKTSEEFDLFYALRKLAKEDKEGSYLFFEKEEDEKDPSIFFISRAKESPRFSIVTGIFDDQKSANKKEAISAESWYVGEEKVKRVEESPETKPLSSKKVGLDRFPIYPGCNQYSKPEKQRNCLSRKAQQFVVSSVNMDLIGRHLQATKNPKTRIYANIIFNEQGELEDIIALAPTEYLAVELLRIMKSFPKTRPALKDGKTQRVSFTLPVIIAK